MIDANTDSCLLDHKIKNSIVLPLCYILNWFCQFLQDNGLFDRFYHLTEVKVLQGVKLNHLAQQEIFTVKNLSADKIGLLYHEKTADTCQFSMEEIPFESIEIGALDDWPWTVAQAYNNNLLFHGPAFQVIDTLLGINSQGALATLKDDPQKNNSPQCIPSILIDGGFQLACLWINVFLNKASVPMSMDHFFYTKNKKIHSVVTCQIKGEIINNSHCRFDLIFLSENAPFAMIKGLNMLTFEG